MVTREQIINLSHDNSALSMCVYQARHGFLTWEEAMMLAVDHFVKENKTLTDTIIRMKQNEPPRPLLMQCNFPRWK